MLLNNAFIVAALQCLAAAAAPTEPVTQQVSTSISRTAEEAQRSLVSLGAERVSDPAGIALRDNGRGMTLHKVYNIAGWIASVGYYAEEQFAGAPTGNTRLPVTPAAMSTLAQAMAYSIRSLSGGANRDEVTVDLAGGWRYVVELLASNVRFSDIPYNFLDGVIYDALVAAAEFPLFTENALTFILNDAGGHGLLQLEILPTVHAAIARFHDEL
ncbi:hypothetical protein NQ176_g3814 [Zarea fungicola]|uniref:Uncharacterized protein n=1 Tax=Zarea fungicola TaxID=93591 RepID=A0ACC1NI13_9HYPO|nr:hypothetical protein NQ176_g3814 [Lecanicillium fungicola]